MEPVRRVDVDVEHRAGVVGDDPALDELGSESFVHELDAEFGVRPTRGEVDVGRHCLGADRIEDLLELLALLGFAGVDIGLQVVVVRGVPLGGRGEGGGWILFLLLLGFSGLFRNVDERFFDRPEHLHPFLEPGLDHRVDELGPLGLPHHDQRLHQLDAGLMTRPRVFCR